MNEILAKKESPFARPPNPIRTSSFDQQAEQQQQQQPAKKDSKKDKKKIRDDEKLEKRRLKEEERLRRQEKKLASKKSKPNTATSVGDDGVPLFIRRCIEFIELEGLDAEGIYRVPGNRAHVDAFVQKFKDNPDMSIESSDIPVNAVATALKDFLSKKWGPIIPLNLMNELTELSNISEKEQRVDAVRELVNKLPSANYKLLRFVFSHFVKVSLNHSLNSMDSKNLAICWWPTLLPLHFSDMVMFEQMRPHLEESIQTMIDQYDYIFDYEEPAMSQVN